MASEAKHTPLPWRLEGGHSVVKILSGNQEVAVTDTKPYWREHDETDRANAELIVTAVNERADLLAKLEQYRKALEEIRDLDRARVRRALAPGEQPNPAAVSLAKAGSIAVAALSTPEQASLPTAQVKG